MGSVPLVTQVGRCDAGSDILIVKVPAADVLLGTKIIYANKKSVPSKRQMIQLTY